MFEDSMIESRKMRGSGRRGAATILSFALQVVVIGALILIPLFVTQAIPTPQLMTKLAAPPPPPPPPPPPAAASATSTPVQQVVKPLEPDQIRVPSKIPDKVVAQADTPPPPSTAGVTGGVPGGVAGGQIGGVVGGVLGAMPQSAPTIAAPKRVNVSQGVAQGLLVHKVVPQYPPMARDAHIQGSVVLEAVIGKDGKIQNVQVVSGPQQLAQAAVDAVRQWRYKPYYLNGQPVEVQTMINVNFNLGAAG